MLDNFPEAKFILLKADKDIMAKRLVGRQHFVSKKYADELEKIFEEPKIDCYTLYNNNGEEEIISQFKNFYKN
ncbi:hypothetical protein KKH39_04175 [Patescibacteria group bacterium]|nr:hypothetical protein [Patescibacteria group bacterium]